MYMSRRKGWGKEEGIYPHGWVGGWVRGGHKAKLSVIIETFNPCAVFVADMGGEGQQRLYQGDFAPSVFFTHLLGGGDNMLYRHTYVRTYTCSRGTFLSISSRGHRLFDIYRTKTVTKLLFTNYKMYM